MRKLLQYLCTTLLLCGIILIPGSRCHAYNYTFHPDTNYTVTVMDDALLLDQTEEKALLQSMLPIAKHGHVLMLTSDRTDISCEGEATVLCNQLFGNENSVVFVINMGIREIYIYAREDMCDSIDSGHARSIADNVYRYASKEDYFTCADRAFTQINSLLNGDSIAQPMKYICNALLSMIVALLLGFGWVCIQAYRYRPQQRRLLDKSTKHVKASVTDAEYTDTHFLTEAEMYGNASYLALNLFRILLSLFGGGGFSGGSSGSGRSGGGRSSGGGHRF